MPSHLSATKCQSRGAALLKRCLLVLIVGGLLIPVSSARAQNFVQGTVSGVWNDSLYMVVGDILIEEGQSLIINPGVRIRFEGNHSFGVRGLLRAEGNADESIYFYGQTQWRGIYFFPETSPSTQLKHCSIDNAYIAVQCERAFVAIQNCSINARNVGIKCIQSSPIITNNKLIRVYGSDALGDVKAISILSNSNPLISGNELIEAVGGIGDAYGIWIEQGTPSISDNWIEVTAPNKDAIGIYAFRTIKVDIVRNIIRTRSIFEMRNIWLVYATNVRIISNDLILLSTSEIAICIHVDQSSMAQITYNIIMGNGHSIGDYSVEGQVDTAGSGYNDYYLHNEDHVGDWRGHEDISADPLFAQHSLNIDECDYSLTWVKQPVEAKSPCIDAGSPNVRDDYEWNTPSDIGRFPFIYEPVEVRSSLDGTQPFDHDVVTAFPNPFNRSTTLSFTLASPGLASILVFDVNGRQLATLWNGPLGEGKNRLVWSAEGFTAGEYFIRCELPGSTQIRRVSFLP